MRTWIVTLLKLVWGVYFLLTSLYCLLAFLPYTYYALIKAPAYAWMPWFVHHHAFLYWVALAAVAVAYWPKGRDRTYFALLSLFALAGAYVTLHPFMAGLRSDWTAYLWSLLALAPLMLAALVDVLRYSPPANQAHDDSLFVYSNGVLVAAVVSTLYVAGAQIRVYAETHSVSFGFSDVQLAAWSLATHVLVAIIVLTLLNLVRLVGGRTRRPAAYRFGLIGLLAFAGLWLALARFLGNALSFEGWASQVYAASLAAGLTLFSLSLASPWLSKQETRAEGAMNPAGRKVVLLAVVVILAVLALALPAAIHNSDWNGVLETTFTLGFWLALGVCLYRLRPRWGRYSLATILAVFLIVGFTYKGLQFTAIFWGRPLGPTDDDIARAMETYAGQDASFQLAHHLLGNAPAEHCGDLCRVLREYTNIRDVEVRADVNLVDRLLPVSGNRPNIFLFVIDSLRPDYVGAYNPRVDFTPNLDALARDGIALRHAFTQYAGTTLSEPAIWSGAMLLHTHYMQPFAKVNGLEKLAKADGYQMVVSYDTVLSQLLSPADDLIALDTDKPLWNRFEMCSTVEQTEKALDARRDKTRPVLFYAQPMNVHQFARNDRPLMKFSDWRLRPGFNNRVAYEVHTVDECMGSFLAYLKSRGMYDNSVIIVTSDHGDATGEMGRFSHAISLYPEIMRVPLIVHLPPEMRKKLVYDDSRVSTLTDITPSLYYLLGHRPIRENRLLGRPLFAETREELDRYPRGDYLLASDVRAAYGILAGNGRFLYFTLDSPPESFLFDLQADPQGQRNVVTEALKKHYDQRIIEELQAVADFYGYKPGMGSFLASAKR